VIQIDLALLPLLYTTAALAVILVIWLSAAWQRAWRRRQERRALGQCRLCAAWLRYEGPASLLRCPACGALNERNFINDI